MLVESIYIGVYRGDVGLKVGEVLPKVRSCGSVVDYWFFASVNLIVSHPQVFLTMCICVIMPQSLDMQLWWSNLICNYTSVWSFGSSWYSGQYRSWRDYWCLLRWVLCTRKWGSLGFYFHNELSIYLTPLKSILISWLSPGGSRWRSFSLWTTHQNFQVVFLSRIWIV